MSQNAAYIFLIRIWKSVATFTSEGKAFHNLEPLYLTDILPWSEHLSVKTIKRITYLLTYSLTYLLVYLLFGRGDFYGPDIEAFVVIMLYIVINK